MTHLHKVEIIDDDDIFLTPTKGVSYFWFYIDIKAITSNPYLALTILLHYYKFYFYLKNPFQIWDKYI